MDGDKRRIDHLTAATSALRLRVDALLNSPEAPKDVVDAAMSDLRAIQSEMKPLAAVASEFGKRWQKQKQAILQKREAEVEFHLRQASSSQLGMMEEEAQEKLDSMQQEFEATRRSTLEALHQRHSSNLNSIVEDWKAEAKWTSGVKDRQIADAIERQIERIIEWAIQEEEYIMKVWEQELADMMCAVHTMDEEEIQAMESVRNARCSLLESTVQRQQRELLVVRNDLQGQVVSSARRIMQTSEVAESKAATVNAVAKRQARARALARKEAEAASQRHVDVAVGYLDEAAALERARVSAYHASMQGISSELQEQLQAGLVRETEAANSKSNLLSNWSLNGQTSAGLLKPSRQSFSSDDDENAAAILQNEVIQLREKARIMMASVGRSDWRKDILEVCDAATEDLLKTESALAAGPLHVEKRSPRSTRELLSSIEAYAMDFSDNVLKEFTRMRNVKVALSCARSKQVREAMKDYEMHSQQLEDVVLPAVSRLAHEVEVISEVVASSRNGKEKMPVYVIAAAWRRALLATYPVLKRLWETAEIPDSEQKHLIRKICMTLAVDANMQPAFQEEAAALEATLPGPDWAVGV